MLTGEEVGADVENRARLSRTTATRSLLKPHREDQKVAAECTVERRPRLLIGDEPLFEVRDGGGALCPRDQVERTRFCEVAADADSPAILDPPMRHQRLAGQYGLDFIQKAVPTLNSHLIDDLRHQARLLRRQNPDDT